MRDIKVYLSGRGGGKSQITAMLVEPASLRDIEDVIEEILDWTWTDEDKEMVLLGLRMAYTKGSKAYDLITEVIHKENGGY